jgi:glycerol-3-phosphate dehydrogenase
VKRDPSALAGREFDLVVVGGGIYGICVARDAALRGLSVALIDKADFAHAASAQHFKLVHGGIRYLQHADIERTREASTERNALLRLAPHLVQPVPFVIPTYGHGMQGKEVLALGLALYNRVCSDRNQGIVDPQRAVPPGRILSRHECLRLFPHLEARGLTGAVVLYEAQIYNPPRLSLSFLRSAVAAGAVAANYVQARGVIRSRDRVAGVKAIECLSGDPLEIRGRVVVNAAGPWAGALLASALGLRHASELSFSRDAWFVVNRPLVSDRYALALPAASRDDAALISRGHRHLFLVPWRGHTLVGVWHRAHLGGPDEWAVTPQDLQQFIAEVNHAYPSLALSLSDIALWNAGLILFGNNHSTSNRFNFGKRSVLIDHDGDGATGLITLVGVRYTTARADAQRAVDLVFKKLDRVPPKAVTATTPIYGGPIERFDEYAARATRQLPVELEAEAAHALIRNYGTAHLDVVRYMQTEVTGKERLGSTNVVKAEVIHGVREEMAQRLADVVFRRTELGTRGHPGSAALAACAAAMAAELGWDKNRTEAELADVTAAFPHF